MCEQGAKARLAVGSGVRRVPSERYRCEEAKPERRRLGAAASGRGAACPAAAGLTVAGAVFFGPGGTAAATGSAAAAFRFAPIPAS
jgi:hypothetical protein